MATTTNAPLGVPARGRHNGNARSEATALIQSGQYAAAVRLLRQELAWDPVGAEVNYLLGTAAYRAGDLATAQRAFQTCVGSDPGNAPALYGLGITFRDLGEPDAARRAFQDALTADPTLTEARTQLAKLTPADRPRDPPRAPTPSPPAAVEPDDEAALSLAEMLDVRGRPRLDYQAMAGEVRWSGRPSPRALVGGVVGATLLLLVPLLLHEMASRLPPGLPRLSTEALGRITSAIAPPAALILVIVVAGRWATRSYLVRRHRIEVFSGLLIRQHVTVWIHDLERPVIVRQHLWQLALGIGTIQIPSTVLPPGRGRRAANRPGEMVLSDLPIDVAEWLGATIMAETLWQRRRMVQNFVSSR